MTGPRELIVIAAHGVDHVGQCVASLSGATALVVDTGPTGPVPGQHPTGAYIWAYRNVPADRYLFVQDSMTANQPDPAAWFREQYEATGAPVAWGRFPMAWDGGAQEERVREQYGWRAVDTGVFGPVFYISRAKLGVLDRDGLLPRVPTSRLEAQGTERAWAFAFDAAGWPAVGPMWDPEQMKAGRGGWRKVWAARP